MPTILVVLLFAVVGVMRVIQKVCYKTVSFKLNDSTTFFHYGGYYYLISTLFALISLAIVGFYGFNLATFVCALLSAVLFAIDLFSSIEAIKGTTLVVCNMFACGGLFVPCILGIFLFNEPMSIWQWFGLVLFIVSVYFISAKTDVKAPKMTLKTLIMLIISFTVNGLIMVVQKYFGLKVEGGNVSLYTALTFALNSLILYSCMLVCGILNKGQVKKLSLNNVENTQENPTKTFGKIKPLEKLLLICGLLLAVALFAIQMIITELGKTVESAILFTVSSALSIIITCLVGSIRFKEKMRLKNYIGLVLGFASILIVSFL